MKVLSEGYRYSKKTFVPPASPSGFVWPHDPTKDQRKAFQAAFLRLLEGKGLDIAQFAKAFYGEIVNAAGFRTLRDRETARKWLNGASFPRAEMATVLASYFDVSTADLLKGAKVNGNGNGHDNEATAATGKKGRRGLVPPPARLALPKDAPPAAVKIETFAGDPRFVSINVSGTLQVDVALSVLALITPREGHESDSGE